MKKRVYEPTARFQTVKDACRTTGLSQNFLRKGCKAGTIPAIRSGRVWLVDVVGLYKTLEAQMEGQR